MNPSAQQSPFPFNITLHFGQQTDTEENQQLIFLLPQNYIAQDELLYNALANYALFLSENQPAFVVDIIFTANDSSLLPGEYSIDMPSGTKKLIADLNNSDKIAVFVLTAQTDSDKVHILCGSAYKTAPQWQLEALRSVFEKTAIPYSIVGTFLSLYKLGWVQSNPIIAEFMQEGIPAVQVQFPSHYSQELLTSFFKDLEAYFQSNPIKEQWDNHYIFWKSSFFTGFISENILVRIMLIVTGISLFTLIGISFIFGKQRFSRRTDFVRTWWLLPSLFIITCAALFFAQHITQWLYQSVYGSDSGWLLKPYTALLAKTVFASTIIILIILPQRLFHFPQDEYIYGYLAYLTSIINMFIFSSFDFSLLILFAFEYILSFIFSKTKRLPTMILTGIIMIIPFFVYVYPLLGDNMLIGVQTMLEGASFWNVRLTLLLLPFEFVCIKILIKLKLFGAYSFSKRKTLTQRLPYAGILFLLVSITMGIIIINSPPFSEKVPLHVSVTETVIDSVITDIAIATNAPKYDAHIQTNVELSSVVPPRIQVHTKKTTFLDRTSISLSIKTGITVQRIEVRIFREDGFAVFDANYPFITLENGNVCIFYFDEHPPNPLLLEFTTKKETLPFIEVTVFSIANPDGIFSEDSFVLVDTMYIETQAVKL